MKPATQHTNDDIAQGKVTSIIAKWSSDDKEQYDKLYPSDPDEQESKAFSPDHVPDWVRRKNIVRILDRFFKFVKNEYPSSVPLPFAERVIPDIMMAFADELGVTCRDGSICDYMLDIVRYAQACDPNASFRIVKTEARRFGGRRNRRKKRLHQSAHRIWKGVQERLDTLEIDMVDAYHADPRELRTLAEEYRNLLQIGFLARLPLRLKNFQSLDLTTHFSSSDLAARVAAQTDDYHDDESRLHMVFKGYEMKNRKPYATWLSGALARRIRFYAEHIRHHLADAIDPLMTRLWIAPSGAGESAIGIHQCIARVTSRIFAARLTAHDFRHIVASTAASDGMSRREIAALLQQVTGSATVEWYISSWSDQALRDNRSSLDKELEAVSNRLPRLAFLVSANC